LRDWIGMDCFQKSYFVYSDEKWWLNSLKTQLHLIHMLGNLSLRPEGLELHGNKCKIAFLPVKIPGQGFPDRILLARVCSQRASNCEGAPAYVVI